jgi:hypothetical protein
MMILMGVVFIISATTALRATTALHFEVRRLLACARRSSGLAAAQSLLVRGKVS